MVINNIELITPLLIEDGEYPFFYPLRIVGKDCTGKYRETKIYFIKNAKHLRNLMSEIIRYCIDRDATAYIDVNPRSYEKFQNSLILRLAQLNVEKDAQDPSITINEAVGRAEDYAIIVLKNPVDDEKILKKLDAYFKLDTTLPIANTRESTYLKCILPDEDYTQIVLNVEDGGFCLKGIDDVRVLTSHYGALLFRCDNE